MLTGQVDDLPDALVGLTTTGLLRDHDVRIVEKWIDALEGAGALRASADVYRTLRLTAHGREVMAGRLTDVSMVVPELHVKAAGRSRGKKARLPVEASGAEPNEEIVDALRAWRRQEAARRQVPPYVILHDKTVVALATARPASLSALESVSGMGPAKVSQYGETLVRLITQPTAIL